MTVQQRRRWMGVGRSAEKDSRTAALAAVSEALVGAEPKQILIMVFAGIDHDLAALIEAFREVSPGTPVIGCTTHGEIGPGGPSDGTVTVAALGGAGLDVRTRTARNVSGRQREAGAEIAASAEDLADRPYRVLVMFTDGQIRDQESILRGAYGVVGASVPLFGGRLADDRRLTVR